MEQEAMEKDSMNEFNTRKNSDAEIDFTRLLHTLMDRAWIILLVSVLCAALVLLGTWLLITPQYEASAVFYVNNSALSIADAALSIESGDISASKSLVNTYIVILKDRVTLVDILDYAGIGDMTWLQLSENISAEALNETEVFRVTVNDSDPEHAQRLANAVAYILPKRISSIIDGSSAKIVSDAVIPVKPSSPSYTNNTVIGFLLGFLLCVGVIALREIYDITIREEQDITQNCKHPILAAVPDMTAPGKGGGYYSYGRSRKEKSPGVLTQKKQDILGPHISFAASEAYKLLRAKLQFSFADENDCHIIGLSSALSGEGKSLTAVNLAYNLSQLDKKVLLVDCDMRRPTLAEKLNIQKYPGLSNYLTRQSHLEELIQPCQLEADGNPFHVIAAGQNPPNPAELLSSQRMRKALNIMREQYDYVILDLPPVGEVSDVIPVAKEIDGILLVVRQNYCDRNVLMDAVQQFAFIHAKILGVVFNCTSEAGGKGYYNKKYYKRYYKNYGRKYEDRVSAQGSRA